MSALINISNLTKTYAGGFTALENVDLAIHRGEILALLGPNGAGKTTLISIVCGIINPTAGSVTVDGYDIISEYRKTRSLIGLVPQELATETFETVLATVAFSRGLFGKHPDPGHIERILIDLSLWDKRNARIKELSGGMKRRVMIAKALSHEPRILFLDEPTAGVDVELRRDMWRLVNALRASGVTIILTTHYIEEAEAIADRIAIINHGRIILVEEKAELMRKLGKKELVLDLRQNLAAVPEALAARHNVSLAANGGRMTYTFDSNEDCETVTHFLEDLAAAGIQFKDLKTEQSSLEDIFVSLVNETR